VGTFVLRSRGPGTDFDDVVALVRSLPEVRLLDVSAPRMLLVAMADAEADHLAQSLPGWIVAPQQTYALPDPRPHPRSPE
jgi:hypothetical protein